MAIENIIERESMQAGVDFTTAGSGGEGCAGYLVKQNAAGLMILAAASGDILEGALLEEVPLNSVGSIKKAGVIRVKCGGTVALGNWIVSDATGRGVASALPGTDYTIGRAREAGVVGQFIAVTVDRRKV